jgi:hypothetical protein
MFSPRFVRDAKTRSVLVIDFKIPIYVAFGCAGIVISPFSLDRA